MANLRIDWFGRSLSRRADKTSNTYAKVNNITGKTFLVTLRNPYTSDRFKDANIAQNNKMGALWMGIAAWVKQAQSTEASAEDAAQLERFVKGFKSQHKYATLRGFIAGKRYAVVNDELTAVTIKDGEYTKTVEFVFNARPLVDAPEDPGFSGGDSQSGNQGGNSSSNVTISLSAVGNGKVSIDGGTAGISKSKSVAPGTSVAILATPDSGATFTRWSDGNTEASRNVTVNAAMSLTATFSGGNAGGGDGPSEG